MAVTHDYRCSAHGPYEGTSAKCPHCGHSKFTKLEFNQAPSFKSARTKNSDSTLKQLALDYKMTNIKNDKAGGSVMDAMRKGNRAPAMQPGAVMQSFRENPRRESAWLGSAAPGAFAGVTGNALKQVPMSQPRPQYVARDPGEYRK